MYLPFTTTTAGTGPRCHTEQRHGTRTTQLWPSAVQLDVRDQQTMHPTERNPVVISDIKTSRLFWLSPNNTSIENKLLLLTTNRRNTHSFTVNKRSLFATRTVPRVDSVKKKANLITETSKSVAGYEANLPQVFASNRPPIVDTRQCDDPVSSTSHTHIRAATGPISSPNRLNHCPLTAEARVQSQDMRGFRSTSGTGTGSSPQCFGFPLSV
jgi:hypothetical protein